MPAAAKSLRKSRRLRFGRACVLSMVELLVQGIIIDLLMFAGQPPNGLRLRSTPAQRPNGLRLRSTPAQRPAGVGMPPRGTGGPACACTHADRRDEQRRFAGT